jgi:hypothetical protein
MPKDKDEEDTLLMAGLVQVAAALVAKLFRRAQTSLFAKKETKHVTSST